LNYYTRWIQIYKNDRTAPLICFHAYNRGVNKLFAMKIVRFKKHKEDYFQYGFLEKKYVYQLEGSPFEPDIGLKDPCDPIEIEKIILGPPCEPTKIVGLAMNYEGATGQPEQMSEPLVFMKPSTSVIGPGETITCPFKDIAIWGECELAIVIGKRAKNIQSEKADDYILGYTIANDVTADNIHRWDHHLARSKGVDTFCPLGPWIDTKFKPENQLIEGYQNSELLRRGSLDKRLFKERELISLISSWMTLEPWDIILTGAPTRIKERRYLQPGDVFTCHIEGLGQLENRIEAAW